jgi:hypothetical protein
MKTTLKTLSALAIAAAALTAVTLASGSAASANPYRGGGHGPVVLHKVPLFAGRLASHLNISCLACNLPRPHPKWGFQPWRLHQWGFNPWRYSNWGFRYNRWYWEHRRDRYGYRGRPGEFGFAASAASAPAMSAPAQASAGQQGCLTEQKMPDGSVTFADVCKQISAIAAPPSADPRQ